jgi:hypothetical protein
VLISDDPASATGIRYALLLHRCMQISFPAESGGTFRVEASSDLMNWESTFIGAAEDGMLQFIEPEITTFPNRFYRLAREAVTISEP